MVLANDELLTVEEVVQRLKCRVSDVYSLTRRRRANRGLLPLPHRKVGKRLYFVWHDLVQWLNSQPGWLVDNKTAGPRRPSIFLG